MLDHERRFIYNDGKSKWNYSKHILNENHIFNDDFNILHIATKGAKLNALESLQIDKLKNKNKLLNDKLELNNNSPLLNLKL